MDKDVFRGTFKELEMFLFDERRFIDYKAQNAIVGSQLSLQQNGETHQASQQKYPFITKVWWEMLAVGHHSGDEAAELSSINFGSKGSNWSSDILHNTPWVKGKSADVELKSLTIASFGQVPGGLWVYEGEFAHICRARRFDNPFILTYRFT